MSAITRHIFLTGFMGSGKTTAGKKLANLLSLPFIDLDETISNNEHRRIAQIFEEKGEAYFRNKETEVLNGLNSQAPFMVISLGGGTVCFNNNLEIIKKKGLLIYLELPPAALAERLKNAVADRPLLQQRNGNSLEEHIDLLLEKRKPFYQQAHLVVNGLSLNPQHLETLVRAALSEHNL